MSTNSSFSLEPLGDDLPDDLRAIWAATEPAPVAADPQAFLNELRPKLMPPPTSLSRQPVQPIWRRRSMGIPVAVLAASVAAVLILPWSMRSSASAIPEVTELQTTVGERAAMTLPDGSRIILAPQSAVRVSDTKGARTVRLQGEAFFEVASASRTPFTVQTGGVATRVLGTAFNIRFYDSLAPVQVSVITGKVESVGERSRITLTEGMSAEVTDSVARPMSQNAAQVSAWQNGQLVFDDVPAAAVLTTLGRWYGYRFRMSDSSLARRHVTAVFNIDERQKTMAALQDLLEVTMTVRDSVVVLLPRRHNTSRVRDALPYSPRTGAGK